MLIQTFPDLKADELLMYPTLFDNKTIKEVQHKSGTYVMPAAGMGVLRKSSTTAGILSELEQLSQEDDYSSALKAFLGESHASSLAPQQWPLVPAVLSEAQQCIFEAVANHQLVQITGPPGTGKSFIIVALAVDCMSKGKSVLIVSANDQAVDVIHQKIGSDFDLEQIAVRGGGKRDYKSMLKDRLANWLNGVGIEKVDAASIRNLKQEVEALRDQLASLEQQYVKTEKKALKEGKFLANYQSTWLQHLQHYFLRWRMQREIPLWKILSSYQHMLTRKHQKIKELLYQTFHFQLYQTLRNHRRELRQFLAAIRVRTSSKKENIFNQLDFDLIHKTLPVWLVTITEASHILPLKKELFDVVVIDEATQCDIASILPILQRGKKVVIAGDPKQLRHVCFLSRSRQRQIAENCGLLPEIAEQYNYRDHSLLDIVNRQLSSQEALIFLNEHYRSQPSIIAFSNAYFYHKQLRVMTAQPQNKLVQHVHLLRVAGSRNENGYNEQEANHILQKIKEMAEEEAHLPVSVCQSIGILSPFRQQANYIQKRVLQELDISILLRHRLLIGTPYSFQGDERDVMFISLVVDQDTHSSTFQHLAREDVFNVSITRARSEQWVITSLQKPTGYASAMLLERYLAHIEQNKAIDFQEHASSYRDEFLKAVVAWLKKHGIQEIHQQYPIAGIDLVIVNQGKTDCIDLVGYPGAMEQAFTLERCKILQRIGIYSFPLSYSRWHLDFEKTNDELIDFLGLTVNF